MDERTRLFLWVLAGEGVFAALGGLFGALTGLVHACQGRVGGTPLGQGVARAYARGAEDGLSLPARGTLIGGIDGMAFGAVVGTLVGLAAAWQGPDAWPLFRLVLLTSLFLVLTALALGGFAGLITLVGPRAVVGLFAGGMSGALLGFSHRGADGLFLGTLLGAALGGLLACLRR